MTWTFLLTDMVSNRLSELAGIKDKRLSIPINGMATASFTIRLDHEDADLLLDCNKLLQVWEINDTTGGRALRAHLRQVTAEENGGDNQTIACTFADPF